MVCFYNILVYIVLTKSNADVIRTLLPSLSPGDVIIDGGNSHFPDTERRVKELQDKGIHFIGMGVSGGEEGALNGPALMPGGATEGWPLVQPILENIAAIVPEDNTRCCSWVGEGGSGHYVKMVHNGIEYGDMQLVRAKHFFTNCSNSSRFAKCITL